jgi:hypothetical protein
VSAQGAIAASERHLTLPLPQPADGAPADIEFE